MCAGEWNGCCIPRPCAVDPCGRKPFPQPCPDPPSTCCPDPPGWQVPVNCAPDGPPPFRPPGCRPGPEICISRPCVEDCRPKPPRPPWPICRPKPQNPDCCFPNYPTDCCESDCCEPDSCRIDCCDRQNRGQDSCREEYFASFREFRIAQLIEALNRMIGGCR